MQFVRTNTVRLILIFGLFLFIAGCATSSSIFRPAGNSGGGLGPQHDLDKKGVTSLRRYPWETWAIGRTLGGMQLRNLGAIEGDQYRKSGELKQAQKIYTRALSSRMSADERESIILRRASMDLAFGEASAALALLSDHFKNTGRSVDEVSPRFSLIFAYAYAYEGDTAQALAWFSKTNRVEAGQSGLADIASDGLRMYLRGISDAEFYSLSKEWATDSLVSLHLGREGRRRAAPDYIAAKRKGGRFWELDGEQFGVFVEGDAIPLNTQVGVLLPLSGKFSRLGLSVQRGIELAALGQNGEVTEPIFRDTQGDAFQANIQLQEMSANQNIEVLLGPLLSDVAELLIQETRSKGLPTVVFSKRSFFPTGDGVFRLGPTFRSQVYSLVSGTRKALMMRNYGLVFPQTEVGQEYARVFRQAVQDLGGAITYEATYYPEDDTSLVAIASEIETTDVEGVFFPDSIVMAARFYGNLNPLLKQRIRLLGAASWDNPAEIARSRGVLEGMLFVSPFFQESKRPVVEKFVQAYRSKFNRKPDFLAAQGFDAATLVFGALKRKQDYGGSFEAALRSISHYEGLTGSIEVGSNGEIHRTFPVVELKRGKLQEISNLNIKSLHLG